MLWRPDAVEAERLGEVADGHRRFDAAPVRCRRRTAEIAGDLFGLVRGTCDGRQSADEITLFKSVGTALEDLAAAKLAFSRFSE